MGVDGAERGTRDSILSDELVQQLVEAGQVDLLVGIPSFNHAATIGDVARRVHVAFARHFPRERTLLLNVDGGSTDGTVDAVRSASPAEADSIVASQALRTIHRISVPYHGTLGKPAMLRTLLTAADLLQARAMVVVDPAVCSLDPAWIRDLATPVLVSGADYTAPLYARHPLDGPLVTQLVRPLTRALFGWRLREPLGSEFGLSGRFVRHVLDAPMWQDSDAFDALDLRIAVEAMAAEVPSGEVPLGRRTLDPHRARPPLAAAIEQILQTLLLGVDVHQELCRRRVGSQIVPLFGQEPAPAERPRPLPVAEMRANFERGVRELDPLLSEALPGEPLDALRAAAGTAGPLDIGDELWSRTVFALLDADRRQVLARAHVAQALVPLYLGRAASFLERFASAPPAEVEDSLESLALEFERQKAAAVEHWPEPGRR